MLEAAPLPEPLPEPPAPSASTEASPVRSFRLPRPRAASHAPVASTENATRVPPIEPNDLFIAALTSSRQRPIPGCPSPPREQP